MLDNDDDDDFDDDGCDANTLGQDMSGNACLKSAASKIAAEIQVKRNLFIVFALNSVAK